VRESNQLYTWLSKLSFFEGLIQDSTFEVIGVLIDNLRYSTIKEGQYVFHLGDKGDLFYIILRGSVSVQLPVSIESDAARPLMEAKVITEG
jgi:hypothetical protein